VSDASAVIELALPYPPSLNHYYRIWRGRTLISREGRAYREAVCALLARRGVRPMLGPLAMAVEAYPPDKRRRDLDNLQKSLWDSLQHAGAYGDDGQIDLHLTRRHAPVQGGAVVVRIEALPLHCCPLCGHSLT